MKLATLKSLVDVLWCSLFILANTMHKYIIIFPIYIWCNVYAVQLKDYSQCFQHLFSLSQNGSSELCCQHSFAPGRCSVEYMR